MNKRLIQRMNLNNYDKFHNVKIALDKSNKEHQPIYFTNEYNEDSKDFVYMYKGGYWEDRKNKKFKNLKNVFDTNEFMEYKQKKENEKEKDKDKENGEKDKNNK